jgi:hypothetical protein
VNAWIIEILAPSFPRLGEMVQIKRDGILALGLLALASALSSCSPDDGKASRPPKVALAPSLSPPGSEANPGAGETYSNILREDYIGPEACGKCHAENYAKWKLHPHSRMNQLAGTASVLGDFSGVSLRYSDGEAVFRTEDGLFTMEYLVRGKAVRKFKVTRTIGWRYLQEYVGVQLQGPEPPGDPLYTEETRLKFGYSLKDKKWLPQSYLDSPYNDTEYRDDGRLRYDPFDPERNPFNSRCIHCHNTYPYELRLYSDDRLQGFSPAPAHAVQTLLEKRPQYLDQRHNPSLPAQSLVTVGISCESCHFGGREHSRDVKKPFRFVPTHPELSDWTPDYRNARKNPAIVNAICRQCHFSGSGSWADGSALINSMESIELERGACSSKLKCTDCHNPHVRGPDAGAPDRPEHLATCVACHANLQSPVSARTHGRHDPSHVSCLDCHMPRIVHGFDAINRTHRISSPSDPGILATGMANACNLCHLDRSLAWTRDQLLAGWGRRLELPRYLEAVFGADLARPAGEVWLEQPSGNLKVVAAAAYARSPLAKQALPRLVGALDDPNAYVRVRMLQIVEAVLGRKLEEKEFSLTGPPGTRREQAEALRKKITD